MDSNAACNSSMESEVDGNQCNKIFPDTNDTLLFKKRDIKCKNIRKISIEDVKLSTTNESKDQAKTPGTHSPKKYPKNWTQYKELNLNPEKDAYLKSKLFRKSSSSDKHFNLKKYYNFDLPASPIEPYSYRSLNGDVLRVPFQYLRSTQNTPTIFYNTNLNRTSGYMSKDQLYSLISPEAKKSIEQLWSTKSKLPLERQHSSHRRWFPKQWKNLDNCEAKLLENSLGLSFLQDYSDSEDQDHEQEQEQQQNSISKTYKDDEKVAIDSNELPTDVNIELDSNKSLSLQQPDRSLDGIEDAHHVKSCRKHKRASSDNSLSTSSLESIPKKRKKKKKLKKKSKYRKADKKYKSDEVTDPTKKKLKKKSKKHDNRDKKSRKKTHKQKKVKRASQLKLELNLMKTELGENQVVADKDVLYSDILNSNKNDFLLSSSLNIEAINNKNIDFNLINLEELTQHSQEINELSKKIEKYNQRLLEERKTKNYLKCDRESTSDKNPLKTSQNAVLSHHFDIDVDDIRLPSPLPKLQQVDINDKTDLINSFSDGMNDVDKEVQHADWSDINFKQDQHGSQTNAFLATNITPIKKEIIDINNYDKAETSTSSSLTNIKFDRNESILKKLNTSWDSDEEFFNTKDRPLVLINTNEHTKPKPTNTVNLSSLEIPLNIKHFTRREVIKVDPDAFDIDLNTDEKSKKIEEKQNVRDVFNENVIIKTEKIEEVDETAVTNVTSIKLENEYEEFLKAVTSSDGNTSNEIFDMKPLITDKLKGNENDALERKEFLDIPVIQIPLPPPPLPPPPSSTGGDNFDEVVLKAEATKVESNPSAPAQSPPKLETVIDLNTKPSTINLSLSANVTQNITLSLATTGTNLSTPITSTIDISKPSVEITTPLFTGEPKVSMTHASNDTTDNNCTTFLDNISNVMPEEIPELKDSLNNESIDKPQKIVFTTITLPSKKTLINNSILDDSDNEEYNESVKKSKLKTLIESNHRESLKAPQHVIDDTYDGLRPTRADSPTTSISPRYSRRYSPSPPPYSTSRRYRSPSPLSPRRRRSSPFRKSSSKRLSPYRKRTPPFRNRLRSPTPVKRRRSSISPFSARRRRSYSRSPTPPPRRRRSISPKSRSPKRRYRSRSPRDRKRCLSPTPSPPPNRVKKYHDRSLTPLPSPRRSPSPYSKSNRSSYDFPLATDSNSDPHTASNYDSVEPQINNDNNVSGYTSPRRISLDDRINQVLNYEQATYNDSSINEFNRYSNEEQRQYEEHMLLYQQYNIDSNQSKKTCYKQVGNMLQIVPSENVPDIPGAMGTVPPPGAPAYAIKTEQIPDLAYQNCYGPPTADAKPQIVQVGNMLHIVPQDSVPPLQPPPPPSPSVKIEANSSEGTTEQQSAEAFILQKLAERRREREQRRQEKEQHRLERQMKKAERDRRRQEKLKLKTESLIKKALEMEQMEDVSNLENVISPEKPAQWPPLPSSLHSLHHQKEAGKSILITNSSRKFDELIFGEKKPKAVQFADGIKPGEGTSPSGGEELSSPGPNLKKKDKLYKRFKKKKVKVKVKNPLSMQTDSDDSDENLPPPPPPPGSPPPHIFPPLLKRHMKHNLPPDMVSIVIPQGPRKPPIIVKQAKRPWNPDLFPPAALAQPSLASHHKPMNHYQSVPGGGLIMRPRPGQPPLPLRPPLPQTQMKMTTVPLPTQSRQMLLPNLPPPPPPAATATKMATQIPQQFPPPPAIPPPLAPINTSSNSSGNANITVTPMSRAFNPISSIGQGQTNHPSPHRF